MPMSLSKIYLHITFGTKGRKKLIPRDLEEELYRYMNAIMKSMNCPAIAINGTADHIHILCLLSRSVCVCDLLEEVKKRTSLWIKQRRPALRHFYWQRGYGVFSVSQSAVEHVIAYIHDQKRHHMGQTFRDEYLALLKRYEVSYNEEYLWD